MTLLGFEEPWRRGDLRAGEQGDAEIGGLVEDSTARALAVQQAAAVQEPQVLGDRAWGDAKVAG